jgi:hypothetical protein
MIHVAQEETYATGNTIRAVLRFRWDGEFEAVTVELHRTTFGGAAYGNRIVLRSRNYQRVLAEGEPYTLVELEGTVPETVRSGTYACKYVRCLVPKRGWVILFEDIQDATVRVRRGPPIPPQTSEAAEFLGLDI